MKTYKQIKNGVIIAIGKSSIVPSDSEEIIAEKYNTLMATIQSKPEDTFEAIYRLSNETEKYVACERTHEETVDWYVEKVSGGEMTIEEVPEEYRAEVEAKLPTPQNENW